MSRSMRIKMRSILGQKPDPDMDKIRGQIVNLVFILYYEVCTGINFDLEFYVVRFPYALKKAAMPVLFCHIAMSV